jgi:hypothetical protein
MKFNKKTIQKIGLGVVVAAAVMMIGNVAMASDTGAWTSMEVSGKVSDTLTLSVSEELRFDGLTELDLATNRTTIGLSTEVTTGVTVGVEYRNVSDGEQRVSAVLGLSLLQGTLDLDSLSKIELRDGDTVRGRTELTLSAQAGAVAPFVSEEIFVDDSGITGNRLAIGVARNINNVFGVNAFYMMDTPGTDFANSGHVLGLGLSVSL